MSVPHKSLFFFLGLVLGLLIGAGFFIFQMDGLLKNINLLHSSKKDTVIIQQQIITPPEEKKDKVKVKKYSNESSVKKVMAESDSLLQENIIIKKDELLATKIFQVQHSDQNESANSSDSLLEKISGIKDEKKNIIASFKVEFWQSPVNYKGYKMTKNKIIVFGIPVKDNIKLFHLDNVIYMNHEQNYYKLFFTDDFKQFEKVTDVSLIK